MASEGGTGNSRAVPVASASVSVPASPCSEPQPSTPLMYDSDAAAPLLLPAASGRQEIYRQDHRLIKKAGDVNVLGANVEKWKQKFLVDLFTTLMEVRWRYQILLFATPYFTTWVLFGAIYYGIAVSHGDTTRPENDTMAFCVSYVNDYTSALLFSLETQASMGYGFRAINTVCGVSIFFVMLQSLMQTFMTAFMTGLVFAKIMRPKRRGHTLMFSRNAVVCRCNGEYQLHFRVADMRTKSHVIATSIRALLVRKQLMADGQPMSLSQCPLTLETGTSNNDGFLFLVWPVSVVHRIDPTSPLWDLSAEQLLTEHFEIIVILEGTVDSTGSQTQFRKSYLAHEILWGQRLTPLVTIQKDKGCHSSGFHAVDYSQFHNTSPVMMPKCSAKTLMERQSLVATGYDL